MNNEQKAEYLRTIGNRIKNLRLKKEMTQDELATMSGYTSRAAINKIELGINDVPQSKIKAIADALNVPVGKLLCADEEEPPEDLLKEVVTAYGQDAKQALELYVELDTEDRAEIRGEMKGMLKARKYEIKKESKRGKAI